MKFKSLLFASLIAFGALLTSTHAQIFSPNAVGYVNLVIKPGFNLVANPLTAQDNSIGSLFRNFQGGVPDGLRIFLYVDSRFETVMWEDLDGAFIPESVASETLLPGNGVFLYLPGLQDRVLTFVGEVPQGDVCTDIPQGWSIKSSVVPQTLNLASANFPHNPGDFVFVLNQATQSYAKYQFDALNEWSPMSPTIAVGEAFFVYRAGPATTWCRTFFVNSPQ